MTVLLVNPPRFKLIQAAVPRVLIQGEFHFPPLGLLYVAASLERGGIADVTVLDAQWGDLSWEDIGRLAAAIRADIVGVSVLTTNLVDAWEVLKAVKRHRPQAVTVIGGTHASVFPKESAGLSDVDYVIAGEAEATFPQFVQAISGNHNDLRSIPGLHWVDENGEYHDGGVDVIADDLDALPVPDRSKLDISRYGTLTSRRKVSTSILSNRGCPYRCTFCDVPRTKVRYRSPQSFADEIAHCRELGIRDFHVFDDTFNLSDDRVMAICRELIDRDLDVTWSLRGRVDRLLGKVAEHLKRAGCIRLHLGIESAVPRVLESMGKHIDPEQVREAVLVAKRHGLQVHGFFLIGFPTETREEMAQTLAFAKELRLDYAQFSVVTLYPGTEIYDWAIRDGVVDGDIWRDFAQHPDSAFAPPVWDGVISASELYRLMEQAYRSYYLRPRYVWQSLRSLKNFGEFGSRLKGMRVLLHPNFGGGFRLREGAGSRE